MSDDGQGCSCTEGDGDCTYMAAPGTDDEPTCDECLMGNHEGHEEPDEI